MWKLSRARRIEALSEHRASRPAEIDLATIESFIHLANDEYQRAFRTDDRDQQMWWDGAERMARWIYESHGQ
jgi:hypothetical protein